MTLKFYGWPWKIIGHLFYATSSFVHHFIAVWEFKLEIRTRLNSVLTSVTLTFDLWLWSFAWSSLLSVVITPENFMMIRWQEHWEKVSQTDGAWTDGWTDGQRCSYSFPRHLKHIKITEAIFDSSLPTIWKLQHFSLLLEMVPIDMTYVERYRQTLHKRDTGNINVKRKRHQRSCIAIAIIPWNI